MSAPLIDRDPKWNVVLIDSLTGQRKEAALYALDSIHLRQICVLLYPDKFLQSFERVAE